MDTAPGPRPPGRLPRGPLAATAGAIAVLSCAAVALGVRDWPVPVRVPGARLVADVPAPLLALVGGSAVVCLAVATVLTGRATGLRWRETSGLAWLGLVLVAAGALAGNALVSAADSVTLVGAAIPVLHPLFTVVPALLAGTVTVRRGAAASTDAALGTGVVTMPLLGLGSALWVSREYGSEALVGSLWITGLLGGAPLLMGVAMAGRRARHREGRTTAPS